MRGAGSGAARPGLLAAAAGDAAPETTSLLGEPLHRAPLGDEALERLQANFERARSDYEADPRSEENLIWLGRRLAYLGRYRDAIAVYSHGLELHPRSYKLLRHRGHRYVSLRRFDLAIRDLARAAELTAGVEDEVEPDGAPNAFGIPTSTNQSNIWYHLGLAHYLSGHFEEARAAYETCMRFSVANDMRVATTYWLYMTLRRLGRAGEAQALAETIDADLAILENHAYHDLLLHFRGLRTAEEVLAGVDPASLDHETRSYGLANEKLWNGDVDGARPILRRIVSGPVWAAFGHIAAEADLARLEGG